MPDTEAQDFIRATNRRVAPLLTAVHDILLANGCHPYVKTIYIGYDIGGEMAAAAYAHPDHIEVALALDADHEHMLLHDASHLTWRTLPVAAHIRSKADLKGFGLLASEACARVQAGTHNVHRDNDYFMKTRRERRR